MYKRLVKECPEHFVKNGKPVFGTFSGLPAKLDIRGVKNPYTNLPLPPFITNLRIKSRLSFFFGMGDYIGSIDFFDAKVFGLAEVNIWNVQTKQRYFFRSFMGPRKRFVPHKLDTASTSCYKKARYIRISWDRAHNKFSVIFHLQGDSVRPSIGAAFRGHFSAPSVAQLTSVQPAPTLRRCVARYCLTLPLHGSLTFTPRHEAPKTMQDVDGISFFDINRSYMKFVTKNEYATALSIVDGEYISFRLETGSLDAVDADIYNGNVFFYNGSVTPLPPVVITHPFGILGKWIIQDTENMIDLTFSPVSDNKNVLSMIFLRAEYRTIYGTFDGVMMTADGKKVPIRSMPGLTKAYVIRF